MNFGASYDTVEKRGFVVVVKPIEDTTPPHFKNKKQVKQFIQSLEVKEAKRQGILSAYREEMINLARRMAKKASGSKSDLRNRVLMSALIDVFENVRYETFLTLDQINSSIDRVETSIFVLQNPNAPIAPAPVPMHVMHHIAQKSFVPGQYEVQTIGTIEKPHKGRLVLYTAQDGELYVPVTNDNGQQNVSLIPFNLTEENVAKLDGAAGKKIQRAFEAGARDLAHHNTSLRRIRIETAAREMAQQEMAAGIELYTRQDRTWRRKEPACAA